MLLLVLIAALGAGAAVFSLPEAGPSGLGASPAPSPPVGGRYEPPQGGTWAWQLSGTLDLAGRTGLYDVDLFDTCRLRS